MRSSLVFDDPLAAALFGVSYLAFVLLDLRLVSDSLSGRAARGASSFEQGAVHRPAGLVWIIVAEAAGLAAAAVDDLVLPWRWPLLVAGLLLAWAGFTLRLAAKRTLGRFFVGAVVLQEGHRVVTTGPYAVIRHPGYAGSVLSLAGLGLATGNVGTLAFFVAVPVLVFARTIAVEESALVGALGAEYGNYRRRTWRLVPRVW